MKKFFVISELLMCIATVLSFIYGSVTLGLFMSLVGIGILYVHSVVIKENRIYLTRKSRRKAYYNSLNSTEKAEYNRKILAEYDRKYYRVKTKKINDKNCK